MGTVMMSGSADRSPCRCPGRCRDREVVPARRQRDRRRSTSRRVGGGRLERMAGRVADGHGRAAGASCRGGRTRSSPSATSRPRSTGPTTAIDGGLREAQELDADVADERDHDDGQSAGDEDRRREGQALAGRRPAARGGTDDRLWPGLAFAALAPPLDRAPRPGRARGRARSCAGSPSCRPSRAARCSRRARGRRGSAPGSWCPARPGTGRRPCARAACEQSLRQARRRRRPRSTAIRPSSRPDIALAARYRLASSCG